LQWGDVMSGAGQESIRATVEVERSHAGDPGAVLFGARTNSSEGGSVTFSRLMVSQPGPVQLKITMQRKQKHEPPSERSEATTPDAPSALLHKFMVHVFDNPEMEISNQCLFVFEVIQSPYFSSQHEIEAWNDVPATTVVGRIPAARLMEVLSCLQVFASWAVTVRISPLVSATAGALVEVQHRSGIEAVWTGHGLPRAEMTSFERLGVPLGSTNQKQIRSAYHKQSLKWHPDRWSGIFNSMAAQQAAVPRGDLQQQQQQHKEEEEEEEEGPPGPAALYKLAVQEAFELVAEAYEELMMSVEAAAASSA
jgi:hypothetical protein